MEDAYFIGVDVGTQGCRVVLINLEGELVGSEEEFFPLNDQSREEQSPEAWWNACLHALKRLIDKAQNSINIINVKAVAVTSTSGTIIPVDAQGNPLHPAIMYSDKRSAAMAEICSQAALQASLPEGAYNNFNSSSGLSKMLWFVRTHPDQSEHLAKLIHAADYITGKLCGNWGVTDFTNVLKSGYDVQRLEWPGYLSEKLLLKKEWLQVVVPPGTFIDFILPSLAGELGLPGSVKVVAGMTDGCASQVASGAINPGEWNTTIGTTLVIKGVTRKPVIDKKGRLYNHRHPEGYAMPGGASNTGADWVTEEFGADLQQLNDKAFSLLPTGKLAWPLMQRGERFPFIAPQAKGFVPAGLSSVERFAVNMEGVAYIERYAYEMIENLSGEQVNAIYTAGGGSNSNTWLQIRSDVLGLPVYKMKYTTGAMGAAILAAAQTHFHSLSEAVKALTKPAKIVMPRKAFSVQYNTYYKAFILTLADKGYIE